MSAAKLIETLDKMYRLHEMLYKSAENKTEIIKQNDMDGLNQLLKDEQKYTAAINTMERERQKQTAVITGSETATISDCIEQMISPEKDQLQQLQKKLATVIERLKEQNELNQSLIYQSLQFVNMSMSLFHPQPEQPNYSNPQKKSGKGLGQSIFDQGV